MAVVGNEKMAGPQRAFPHLPPVSSVLCILAAALARLGLLYLDVHDLVQMRPATEKNVRRAKGAEKAAP